MVGLTGVLGEVPAPSGKPGHSFGAGRMETSQSQAREGHHLPASSLRGRPTGLLWSQESKGSSIWALPLDRAQGHPVEEGVEE